VSFAALIDTDILSLMLRNHSIVMIQAKTYLQVYQRFTFSLITRYEILRGLKSKQATAQLVAFERLCTVSLILPLTDEVIMQAANIYADLHQRGVLIGDADILIAATAMVNNLTLVTNNTKHFKRIHQLRLSNWAEA